MTVLTIIFIILAVIGLLAGIGGKIAANSSGLMESEREGAKRASKIGLVVAPLACIGAFLTSSVQVVEANHVGIPVFLGTVGDELKPGLHFVNPFSDINVFDTRNVTSSRLARLDEGDKAKSDCVLVFDGSRAKTCIDISLVLSLKDGNVTNLFKQYQDFESARDKQIRTSTDDAAIKTYREFTTDEIAIGYKLVLGEDGKPTGKKILLDEVFESKLKPKIEKIGYELLSFQLGLPDLTDKTVEDAYLATIAAKEKLKTAKLDKAAAAIKTEEGIAVAAGKAQEARELTSALTPEILADRYIAAIAKAGTVVVPSGASPIINLPQVAKTGE